MTFGGFLHTDMEDTLNQDTDNFAGDLDELGMQGVSDEPSLMTINHRLDVDSVLIEDVKLDREDIAYKSSNYLSNQRSVITCDGLHVDILSQVNQIIKTEPTLTSYGNVDPLYPVPRERCNTWPKKMLRKSGVPADCSPPHNGHHTLPCVSEEENAEGDDEQDFSHSSSLDSCKLKPAGRRNPWGNSSYAELITMAIQSVPDRRLTLSQIYDWMVAAVPYFSERTDSSSSAGWKNSIRHNLSLHHKFLKLANEGAGKSSWWTLNPENNQVKKQRRRSTSGDIRTLQFKREKAKKRVDSIKIKERLVHSSSSSGLTPLSSSYDSMFSQGCLHPLAKSSADHKEGVYSSFRSRNLSGTSSTGQESPLQFDDPTYHDDLTRETDLDTITLDDLNIECEPGVVLMDFQQTEETHFKYPSNKLKILEPREQVSFGKPVPIPDISAMLNSSRKDVLFNHSHTREIHEQDEVRKPMIIKQLNQLTQERFDILLDQASVHSDWQHSLENGFDLKIMLLQEELNKLTREEEMLKISQYTAASNNPYFSVYNI